MEYDCLLPKHITLGHVLSESKNAFVALVCLAKSKRTARYVLAVAYQKSFTVLSFCDVSIMSAQPVHDLKTSAY